MEGKYILIWELYISEFISNFVTDISLYELIDNSKVIEEEDVTVKPEDIKSSRDLLLNVRVQNAVKQYFSSDAWLAVKNTLKMIEGLYILNSQNDL